MGDCSDGAETRGPDLLFDSHMLWYEEQGSFGTKTRLQKFSPKCLFLMKEVCYHTTGANVHTIAVRVTVWR